MNSSQNEEEKIYDIISNSLEALCKEKPNDPIFYLSAKMLEFVGEDINKLGLKLYSRINNKDKVMLTAVDDMATKSFGDTYKIIKPLGVGKFGSVFLAELRIDSTYKYAVKIVEKNKDVFISEMHKDQLRQLDHRNLVKIKDIIEEDNHYFIVNEFCEHGNLLQYLSKQKVVSDRILTDIAKQLFTALKYLHDPKVNINHWEVKPENILVYNFEDLSNEVESSKVNQESLIQIKLVDYGTSLFMKSKKKELAFESVIFSAPECIKGEYTSKSDVWSAGIIMYMLFSCKYPFSDSQSISEVLFNILNKEIEYLPTHPEPLKELLKDIFNKDPQTRPRAHDVLENYFFNQHSLNNSVNSGENHGGSNNDLRMVEVMNNISSFVVGKNLRNIVLNYMATNKLYKEKNFELSKLFEEADINRDGKIDANELFIKYSKFFPGTTEDQKKKLQQFVTNTDINKNGYLDYSEFMIISTSLHEESSKLILKEVFDYFDDNKNGVIEISDLKTVLKREKLDSERLQEMVNEFDQNNDGSISFDEFYTLVQKYN